MKIAGSRCSNCGHEEPPREVAEDEVCNCGSQFCLIRSAHLCLTTNRPRTGTFRRSEREAKSVDGPPRTTALAGPAVKK